MQIAKLRLTNFRNHNRSEYELDRINIFRGPHGTGKSSIMLALKLLLTGKCDITDQAGRGAQDLITLGAKELNVWAQLAPAESSGSIDFCRNGNSAQLRVQAPDFGVPDRLNRNAVAWIEHYIAPIPVLSAVLDAGRFLELDPKDQKALLAGALAADPVEIDTDIRQALVSLGYAGFDHIRSADEVDRNYRALFEQRTGVNREFHALGKVPPPAKPESMPELADVRDKIGEIQTERDQVIARRNQKLAGHSERKLRLTTAQAQRISVEKYVLESTELDEIRKALRSEAKVGKLDATIGALKVQLAGSKRRLEELKAPQADKCPTCGAPITTEDRTEVIATLAKEIDDAQATLEKAEAERRKLPDVGLMKEKLQRHQTALAPYQRSCSTIEEIGTLGPDPDVTAEEAEFETLTERLRKGREIEAEIIAYESALAEHNKVVDHKKKLEEQSAALDRLVEYFSDRGPLKAKLVGDKLPAFVERINQVLDRFGFQCVFTLDPYLILVDLLGSDGNVTKSLRLNQLSESERYRFAIAFQIALAEATGVNLVVIDRADMLLPPARAALLDSLLNSNLEQAFVLTAGEPGPVPEIPGLRVFELAEEVAHA